MQSASKHITSAESIQDPCISHNTTNEKELQTSKNRRILKRKGSRLKITSWQEINHSRMKQAITHSGICSRQMMRAEEYVNWIQCLSCDIWVHENVLEGQLMIDARHVTLNLPILRLSSKPHQSTLKGHSTRPCARTGLKCSIE